MSDLAAWLRLTLAPGIGGEAQRNLLKAFGPPELIFSAGGAALRRHLNETQVTALLTHDSQSAIDAALTWAAEAGNHILTIADTDYPRALLETADPPTLLYVKGNHRLLSRPAIALVGSRNATPQGVENAERFAAAFSRYGLTVVSGLALGIDSAAHRGGLQGDASTIAVIGTGADRVYPSRNRELARAIAEKGVIVSEFPIGTPALPANFPRRNRIISGLSKGVLVIEAAIASGSLITARLAGEQGREVFAIPGSIHSPLSKGCHRLIKQGAKLVESAQDVLEELGIGDQQNPLNFSPPPADNREEHPLLAALGFEACDIDTLVQRSNLTADRVSAMLLQLELEGKVANLPGGRFQRLG